LRADLVALKGMVLQPRLDLLDVLIIPDSPPLFTEFGAKRWRLLWRDSRDSFRATEFHRHCDGRVNTLTIIRDTNGSVFGVSSSR
jgi:hypothetical protein